MQPALVKRCVSDKLSLREKCAIMVDEQSVSESNPAGYLRGKRTMSDHAHSGHRARLRAQYAASGADGLHDHQFLELLLTYAIPRRDTNALAHALLARFGSLEAVIGAEIAQLMLVDGVGEGAATFLHMQGDLMRRLSLSRVANARGEIVLNTPLAAAQYAAALMMNEAYECVVVVCLNAKKAVVAHELIQLGSLTEAHVYPRRVAEIALLRRAHGVLLLHNHPTGDPSPSDDDAAVTDSVRDALNSVGVQLCDHLIVAGMCAYSFSINVVIDTSLSEPAALSPAEYAARRSAQPAALRRVMERYE